MHIAESGQAAARVFHTILFHFVQAPATYTAASVVSPNFVVKSVTLDFGQPLLPLISQPPNPSPGCQSKLQPQVLYSMNCHDFCDCLLLHCLITISGIAGSAPLVPVAPRQPASTISRLQPADEAEFYPTQAHIWTCQPSSVPPQITWEDTLRFPRGLFPNDWVFVGL